ncbi:MAG TPA: D-glycero-beta-D-manno-heptose 1-phosphate adenylyltransferase [Syntrophaceae bacterium]|nr:D-glycero-beta-D-manno-heptose 1-phosphate adenylyltransferase [Syntrophaceae bacterium]
MREKIKTREELKTLVTQLKSEGKHIVFTNGCFDILHVGHIRYLEEAKTCGDHLIVAINSDSSVRAIKGEGRPLVSQDERAEVIAALQCVDSVIIFDELNPLNIIEMFKPHVLVKGGDWTEETIIGADVVKAHRGKVISLPLVKGVSTSSIIERIIQRYGRST